MIGSWARKWFFPGIKRRNTTTSSTVATETTGGGEDRVQWERIVAGLQPMEAQVIKSRLESDDIPALIQQESIGTVMGLTVGGLGAASVWVPEELAERALDILDDPLG